MSHLILEKRDFPAGSQLNGTTRVPVSLRNLLWAAATVGYPPHAQPWRGYGAFHLLARLAAVLGGLESRNGLWFPTPSYVSLESSERAWHTYSLGMTIARWTAAAEFGIAWLQHLAQFPWPISIIGRQRADLVGPIGPGWCVVEAKARQRGDLKKPLDEGKAQVSAVCSVDGQVPALGLSIATKLASKGVRTVVRDPPPDDAPEPEGPPGNRHAVEISPDRYLRAYYQEILRLLRDGEEFAALSLSQNENDIGVFLPGLGLWLGLHRSIYRALLSPESMTFERVTEMLGASAAALARAETDEPFRGVDGVAVALRPSDRGSELTLR